MFEWETIGGYLDCLERNRTATNVAVLVPQVCEEREGTLEVKTDGVVGESEITRLWTL